VAIHRILSRLDERAHGHHRGGGHANVRITNANADELRDRRARTYRLLHVGNACPSTKNGNSRMQRNRFKTKAYRNLASTQFIQIHDHGVEVRVLKILNEPKTSIRAGTGCSQFSVPVAWSLSRIQVLLGTTACASLEYGSR
jgi:hypothetical protein